MGSRISADIFEKVCRPLIGIRPFSGDMSSVPSRKATETMEDRRLKVSWRQADLQSIRCAAGPPPTVKLSRISCHLSSNLSGELAASEINGDRAINCPVLAGTDWPEQP
jgi:hypothetical protein